MREILFRGKTTKKEQEIHAFHNVWVEGDLIKNRYKWHIHPKSNCFRSEKELAKCMIAHEVIPETVGQFTGLTDKNGKKIFEGDIVKREFTLWHGETKKTRETQIGVVVYSNRECRFEIEKKCNLRKPWDGDTQEVIGNIYDNPELLEESNENQTK